MPKPRIGVKESPCEYSERDTPMKSHWQKALAKERVKQPNMLHLMDPKSVFGRVFFFLSLM